MFNKITSPNTCQIKKCKLFSKIFHIVVLIFCFQRFYSETPKFQSLIIAKLRKKYSILLDNSIERNSMDENERNKKIMKIVEESSRWKDTNLSFLSYRLLRLKVGDSTYREIVCTVNKVKQIRRTSSAWRAMNFYSPKGFSVKEVMPKSLYEIYLRNDLMNNFCYLSTRRNISDVATLIMRIPWSDHLERTKNNLLEFQNFEAKQKECGVNCVCGFTFMG